MKPLFTIKAIAVLLISLASYNSGLVERLVSCQSFKNYYILTRQQSMLNVLTDSVSASDEQEDPLLAAYPQLVLNCSDTNPRTGMLGYGVKDKGMILVEFSVLYEMETDHPHNAVLCTEFTAYKGENDQGMIDCAEGTLHLTLPAQLAMSKMDDQMQRDFTGLLEILELSPLHFEKETHEDRDKAYREMRDKLISLFDMTVLSSLKMQYEDLADALAAAERYLMHLSDDEAQGNENVTLAKYLEMLTEMSMQVGDSEYSVKVLDDPTGSLRSNDVKGVEFRFHLSGQKNEKDTLTQADICAGGKSLKLPLEAFTFTCTMFYADAMNIKVSIRAMDIEHHIYVSRHIRRSKGLSGASEYVQGKPKGDLAAAISSLVETQNDCLAVKTNSIPLALHTVDKAFRSFFSAQDPKPSVKLLAVRYGRELSQMIKQENKAQITIADEQKEGAGEGEDKSAGKPEEAGHLEDLDDIDVESFLLKDKAHLDALLGANSNHFVLYYETNEVSDAAKEKGYIFEVFDNSEDPYRSIKLSGRGFSSRLDLLIPAKDYASFTDDINGAFDRFRKYQKEAEPIPGCKYKKSEIELGCLEAIASSLNSGFAACTAKETGFKIYMLKEGIVNPRDESALGSNSGPIPNSGNQKITASTGIDCSSINPEQVLVLIDKTGAIATVFVDNKNCHKLQESRPSLQCSSANLETSFDILIDVNINKKIFHAISHALSAKIDRNLTGSHGPADQAAHKAAGAKREGGIISMKLTEEPEGDRIEIARVLQLIPQPSDVLDHSEGTQNFRTSKVRLEDA